MSRCEAMVLVKGVNTRHHREMYVCCGKDNAQLHHKITRARGGLLLDAVGETYHQMYLCVHHHADAHDQPAFDNGLLIRGSVVTGVDGRPYYTGPDEYLSEHYGSKVHT
jgi:hypothetical protein